MRVDHHAYQRATKVAGFGLLLQAGIGILLLAFGLISKDTALQFAAAYALVGVLVWLGLVIIFHQHKLERLEALEEDEIASGREVASVFDRAADEARVAARRLAMMHRWLIPGLSLLIAALLVSLAWWQLDTMRDIRRGGADFLTTPELGWAIAICLSVAAISFIFSRFVAGMAKQSAWQNLRGGAAYMVGNAVVLVAVAVGIIFLFFERRGAIEAMGWAIPVFIIVLAAEILLNFVLNLYRPRVPGEVPRPAFDSKLLSLLATPDSIVRSLNEAVNYQFGFDVTSSWGYQLLLRSFAWLLALGISTLILLSTMVVVEPHEYAARLRSGQLVGISGSGVMWKWPWPIETAEVHDVTRVRSMHLTARVLDGDTKGLWHTDKPKTDVEIESFLVASVPVRLDSQWLGTDAVEAAAPVPNPPAADGAEAGSAAAEPQSAAEAAISDYYSLVDAEIVLQYRIKAGEPGLREFLEFASDDVGRRQTLTDRERAIKALALAEVSRHFAYLPVDDVLSPGKIDLTQKLRERIQRRFDAHRTGVEVVLVNLPMLRPASRSNEFFEELTIAKQNEQKLVADAQRNAEAILTSLIGDERRIKPAIDAIEEYERLAESHGKDAPQTVKVRQEAVDLLVRSGGRAALAIAQAESDRWEYLMHKRREANHLLGQIAAYRAAPELYRQREQMLLYKRYLPFIDKYVIAVDPAHISVDVDLKKLTPILDYAGSEEQEQENNP